MFSYLKVFSLTSFLRQSNRGSHRIRTNRIDHTMLRLNLDEVPSPVLSPPLKWAGGKRWLVSSLLEYWRPNSDRRLVEPFVGGLAVALGMQPARALLNDHNQHVINFYKWLQRGLSLTGIRLENSTEAFYTNRARFNQLVAAGKHMSREAAGLFYYLNRTCYNGLCRFSRAGRFNVPFGRYKTINYTRDFGDFQGALERWHFVAEDFSGLPMKPSDFVYADPPYDVEFTSYSAAGFGWHDQVRLAEWLARHRGPVIASNQATERIVKLYKELGFKVLRLLGPRRISCKAERKPALEILALRNVDR